MPVWVKQSRPRLLQRGFYRLSPAYPRTIQSFPTQLSTK